MSLRLASRLLRGSSRSRTSGSKTRALASAILCCCPPLTCVADLSPRPVSLTRSITFFTFWSISCFDACLILSGNAMLSKTVMWGQIA